MSYPRGTLRGMETRDSCPTWCARHTVSRCRSTAFSAAGWCHGRPVDVAVQLEQRAGDPVLALLQPGGPPLWLPHVEAVTWVGAAQRLVDAAGWIAPTSSGLGSLAMAPASDVSPTQICRR